MTPDQLRELADALERDIQELRSTLSGCLTDDDAAWFDMHDKTIAFLRQCAEQQPVAWSDGLGSFIEADEKVGDDPDILAYRVPLYAAPAVPQAEPDDDDALVLGEPDMLTPEDVRRLVPQAEPKRAPTCLWSCADDDTDVWETACRHAFTLIEGTPTDNHMAFCCYCGRPLEQEIGGSDAE